MKKRERLEVIRDILRIIKERKNSIKRTPLLRYSNLSTQRFNDYYSDCAVTINAMHPGNVRSNMGENNGKLYRRMKKKLILNNIKESLQTQEIIIQWS